MKYEDYKTKAENWDYYQELLKQNGFVGITDLLTKYKQLKQVQPSPAVAAPSGINIDLITDCLIAYKTTLYADGLEGFRGKVNEQIELLSTPTPLSADPIPRGCELVGIDQLKRMSGIEKSDSSPSAEQPTELEMHRADYQACKDAGFESPCELLAAYKRLIEQPDSAAVEPAHVLAYQYDEGHEDPDLGGDIVFHQLDGKEYPIGTKFYAEPPTKPQRITEQDAREIIEDFLHYLDSIPAIRHKGLVPDMWLSKKGRTLLAKLNEDKSSTREPDYNAQLDKLVAAIDNISPIELKASDNVTIAYGIGFQTWHDLVAIAKASASTDNGVE